MNRVYTAEPYRVEGVSSTGNANGMLLRQYNFPDTYDDKKDIFMSADHDRLFSWDRNHAERCYEKYLKGKANLSYGRGSDVGDENLLEFIKDILKAKKEYPKTKWTGYRILCTINVATGYPVYSFQLFAKHLETTTRVYSGEHAPNVKERTPRSRY